MVPDLLINSLITGVIDAYTALRLSILSPLKAVQCSLMLCSSFSLSLSPSLHSSCPKLWCQAFFSLPRSGLSRCISDTIKYYATGIESSRSFEHQHINLSASLQRGAAPNTPPSLCVWNALGYLFIYFPLKRQDASSLNKLQMELNLEPFRGWTEGRLSKGEL